MHLDLSEEKAPALLNLLTGRAYRSAMIAEL
jgi:hypothetical protein